MSLTPEQAAFWEENGFLVLPGAIGENLIDAVERVVDGLWAERPAGVLVDVKDRPRCPMSDLGPGDRGIPMKINDLFLTSPEVRAISLAPGVTSLVRDILRDEPVLFNTLNMERGTEQASHVDSLFMTPGRDYALAAAWTALEDCHPDSGLLVYYPGSHRIPIYRFSTGSTHYVSDEMQKWRSYIEDKVASLGLVPQTFLPKKGDVFIWHCQLLHGGSPISDRSRTRKSLVSHYFALTDLSHRRGELVCSSDGYWWNRVPDTQRKLKTLGGPRARFDLV